MRVVAVVNAVTGLAGPVWRPVGRKLVSWTGVAIGGLEAALEVRVEFFSCFLCTIFGDAVEK